MRQVQLFDTVSVSYTATIANGEVIEEVPENDPITLTIGSGRILRAVEAAMMGMSVGESRTMHILPEDAFGAYDPSLRQDIPHKVFAGRMEPKPGMLLALAVEQEGEQRQVPATVLAADQHTVSVDYNHPLAGKTITYTVKLHGIGN
ncbi:MAG: peptidylprolyl isomerase [Desulfobulbaceae bacterium]|nr:peptidylprolyl isomerase [Desulfobulbaceae bacterium]